MQESNTYSIGEFADLAGVTVRTLHYYDEIGLLRPSARTNGQHRVYQQSDLLRLQQISTLKYLGFSLQEIDALLQSPAYDVRRSLRIQKDAINERIRQMQTVSFALTSTLELLDSNTEVDWEQVTAVIQGLAGGDKDDWLRRYYTPEQFDWLQDRSAETPPALIEEGQRAWEELIAAFQDVQHLPPDDPAVQALAERMQRLGEMFTAGRPELEQALGQLYSDVTQIPEAYRIAGHDQALQDFMLQALRAYRREHGGE